MDLHKPQVERAAPASRRWLARALCAACLLLALPGAEAAAYRCVDARGHVAYQDVPCAAGARQSEIELAAQPPIGNADETRAVRTASPRRPAAQPGRARAPRATPAKAATSWECRTTDGEVFYRHARCPGSVAGDGVVRNAFTERTTRKARRNPRGAWQRVSVHGRKLSRAEACARIQSPAAAVRDGHLRDDRVSTYDHLMGRDPCAVD